AIAVRNTLRRQKDLARYVRSLVISDLEVKTAGEDLKKLVLGMMNVQRRGKAARCTMIEARQTNHALGMRHADPHKSVEKPEVFGGILNTGHRAVLQPDSHIRRVRHSLDVQPTCRASWIDVGCVDRSARSRCTSVS